MSKSSTNGLLTQNFASICIANFLLFASVYMVFPVLPLVMAQQLGISVAEAGNMYLVFVAAMFAVGPFHAYMGDAYKRKSVYLYFIFLMLFATAGYLYADNYFKLLLLAGVQGACFGVVTTAGITIAIDITVSTRRSAGNLVYAWSARLGMVLGVVVGIWVYRMEGFKIMMYLSVACGVVCMLLLSRVYVAFRAPIGVEKCNLDRFLLPRGWLLAINLVLMAFAAGVLLPLLVGDVLVSLPVLAMLAVLTLPFTKMFVKLSQHCQRGTANTTCHLAMETGVLVGITTTCHLLSSFPIEKVYQLAAITAILSVLFFGLLTYPYYKKKRVRI